MTQPLLSIIVPVYNTARYIPKCIESIIDQDYTNIEIIMVDDGSTDGESLVICKNYEKRDHRIKVISQKNGGLSSARNKGLELCKGDYITFVDSDDYLLPKIYSSAMQQTSEDIDCIVFGVLIRKEDGQLSNEPRYNNDVIEFDKIMSNLVLPLHTACTNKIFKRDFVKGKRFPEGRIHGEDLVFLLSCLTRKAKFKTIDKCGYVYMKHPNSITTSGLKRSSFDEIWCKDLAYEYVCRIDNQYAEKAKIWKFRSRLNIIRRITKEKHSPYIIERQRLIDELKKLYPILKKNIPLKMRIEYQFLRIPFIYQAFLFCLT